MHFIKSVLAHVTLVTRKALKTHISIKSVIFRIYAKEKCYAVQPDYGVLNEKLAEEIEGRAAKSSNRKRKSFFWLRSKVGEILTSLLANVAISGLISTRPRSYQI